ncbi:hypothetical protein MAR_025433 [Mya arenaria]|uniref:Uncharacterized protein n=1 Tax=Mya arenaria TaxID=6604 RepID=A0ABY7E1L5_MYAAR|nr:hypothetical protein MAR_025433 [Mya arenaria]
MCYAGVSGQTSDGPCFAVASGQTLDTHVLQVSVVKHQIPLVMQMSVVFDIEWLQNNQARVRPFVSSTHVVKMVK